MHLFNSFLIAAGAVAVLAAPISEPYDLQDECENENFSSSAHQQTSVVPSTTSDSVPVSSTIITPSIPTVESSSSAAISVIEASSSSIVSISVQPSATTVAAVQISSVPASSSSAERAISSASSVLTSGTIATTTSASASSSTSSSPGKRALEFLGINESGAEFGSALPGTLDTDYTWPSTSSIQTLMDKGMNIFRIPFLIERLAQGTMIAPLDATYLAALKTTVEFITAAGAHAIVDAHNFGRYNGAVFTSTSAFQTFWTNVATEFATNDNVVFDCNNEFHDEPSNTIVANLNQACINGVRAAGATTQYIFVEGTSYTGAWTWVSSGNSVALASLTDPSDKIIYEMHQYLDSDGSGTSSTCVSKTIGAERIAAATTWLQENGKRGIIGEFAGGANADCEAAVEGMLDAMEKASDVWIGALWWGGGPWWGNYIFRMEPPSGVAYGAYIDILTKYI